MNWEPPKGILNQEIILEWCDNQSHWLLPDRTGNKILPVDRTGNSPINLEIAIYK